MIFASILDLENLAIYFRGMQFGQGSFRVFLFAKINESIPEAFFCGFVLDNIVRPYWTDLGKEITKLIVGHRQWELIDNEICFRDCHCTISSGPLKTLKTQKHSNELGNKCITLSKYRNKTYNNLNKFKAVPFSCRQELNNIHKQPRFQTSMALEYREKAIENLRHKLKLVRGRKIYIFSSTCIRNLWEGVLRIISQKH